jgi:regulator of protease activity HflC (stomatin/prohibitin superfamily)
MVKYKTMKSKSSLPPGQGQNPTLQPATRVNVNGFKIGGFLLLLLLLLIGIPSFLWFMSRIELDANKIAILIAKTGQDLPPGEIIALQPDYKGIQLEVLSEGRYFRNPYYWDWEIADITDISAGKLGVLTRLYGKDLPPGQIIAGAEYKGIIEEILRPGKYRINPYAYTVELFDATSIPPGSVGIVTSLVGQGVLTDNLSEKAKNLFLVTPGMKGVIPEVLDSGTYYMNPYLVSVVAVTLQSQRFEMSNDDAISFFTQDGFTVKVEGTIEFSIARDKAALLTHRIGDMDDVLKKIILPKARGFGRIEGSKHPAINFIVGETRQQFQDALEVHLRQQTIEWGVNVKSVLIRNIVPPDEIASIIREREVAVQNARKFEQQIEQAQSRAELARQEMLAEQNNERVKADTARIKARIAAEQEQSVQLTAAQQELQVSMLERDAAVFQAAAMVTKAQGERDTINLENIAQTEILKNQVQALGSGMELARLTLYRKLAPRVDSILSSDNEQGLGSLLWPFLPEQQLSKP